MAMKRNINAVDWIKRATAAQVKAMREALAELPGREPVKCNTSRAVDAALDGLDIPRAYAMTPAPTDGGIPAWFLLKFKVEKGRVVELEKSLPQLRGIHLQEIEDDILRDA